MNAFDSKLAHFGLALRRQDLHTLQLNLGRRCNQACRHCHVDAGPWRTETMDGPTARRIAEWIRQQRPATVDLTGGAPELNPHFRELVTVARGAGADVIDRCNLTILLEAGFEDLPGFLAQHEVQIIASLPCYTAENVARQRGQGVFEQSIVALRRLNALGYGAGRILHLVYNPIGPKLPGLQDELEAEYREALRRDHGVVFHRLLTLTNQPIARFAEELRRQGQWDAYLELLANSFNPATVEQLMCRTTLSVGYQGELYDCDFNQMLQLQLRNGEPLCLWDVTPSDLVDQQIRTGVHCLACTAGSGSSCSGTLVQPGNRRLGKVPGFPG
jgi:radical SAM/Cys-rich protein